MKTEVIKVANVECSGCARTIKNSLSEINGIKEVDVNVEQKTVKIIYDSIERNIITDVLDSIGYPEVIETKEKK